MLPIFEILSEKLDENALKELFVNNTIRTIPLAFLRGVTFNYSFILADEAQNMTPQQMRLLLTRIGHKTKIVIAGDVRQSDIWEQNGLQDAVLRFSGMHSVAVVEMSEAGIVRSPLIAEIERRYQK